MARLEIALRAARDAGLANLESIAAREAPTVGLSDSGVPDLSAGLPLLLPRPPGTTGLGRFQQLAVDLGMAPGIDRFTDLDLQLHGCQPT